MTRVVFPVQTGTWRDERGVRRGVGGFCLERTDAGAQDKILRTVVPKGTESCRGFIQGRIV